MQAPCHIQENTVVRLNIVPLRTVPPNIDAFLPRL